MRFHWISRHIYEGEIFFFLLSKSHLGYIADDCFLCMDQQSALFGRSGHYENGSGALALYQKCLYFWPLKVDDSEWARRLQGVLVSSLGWQQNDYCL